MKGKGYTIKNISASDVQAQDAKTGQIVEATKYSDECVLIQFKDGINAEAYFQTMYLASVASKSKVKMLKQSDNFMKMDTTGIDFSEDKSEKSKQNIQKTNGKENDRILREFDQDKINKFYL